MSHPIPAHHYDENLEMALENLPDLIADSLEKWRTATLDREKTEALLHARFKGEDPDRKANDIKCLINTSDERYQACLKEIKAEAEYQRRYEKLMGIKRLVSLRTAI